MFNKTSSTPAGKRFWHSLLSIIILLSLLLGGAIPGTAQDTEPPRNAGDITFPPEDMFENLAPFKPGEVMVKFHEGVASAEAEAAQEKYGATLLRTLYESDWQLWQVGEGTELSTVEALKADAMVEYAEPNYSYHIFVTPNDPSYNKQWAHPLTGSPTAWNTTTGSSSMVIAIIDTGIDEAHPDLSSKIVAGYDFVDDDTNPHDTNGHGTHVAGIAAATGNNGVGIAGTNWQARIMPIRVLGTNGSGWSSDITDGITWAHQHGAKVLNLSLGGPTYSQAMQDAVNGAYNAGSLVVAAMGNERDDSPPSPTSYPAAYNHVMAVAATNPADHYSYYSNYGSHCDISAPGGELYYLHDPDGIYSTMPTYSVNLNGYGYSQNYDFLQGTSQASPFVAGAAALLWTVAPTLTNDQIQAAFQNTAKDLGTAGWDQDYGHGRIDLAAAFAAYALPAAPTLSAISNTDGDGSYLVDWSDVSGATSYTLQEDDNSSFSSPTTRYSGTATQFQVTGQAGGLWRYRVRATSANGNGAWSATQSVGVVPGAPTLNAISNASNQDAYTISWTAVSSAQGYELQEDDNPSFTSPVTRYKGMAVSYKPTGQPGGTWHYRVRAYNSAGNGAWSNTQSTTTNPSPLAAPTLAAISNPDGDGAYLVNWADVGSATGYILEESDSPYFEAPTQVYSGAASEYNVTGQQGGTHYYRARASDGSARSAWSASVSVVVNTTVVLPAVLKNLDNQVDILAEGFEGGAVPPSGWSRVQTNANQTWKILTVGTPYAGNYAADVEYDTSLGSQNEVLLTPSFSASKATLTFYSFGSPYWCRDTHDNCDLNVWIVRGNWGGTDDTMIRTVDADWTGTWIWSLTTINLTPYLSAGTPVRVAFQYIGQDGAQIGLDQITIISP
ncbi:MAG: S8 family serine peptidase [Anaerolineales bacterium]|nr:S8 family serine peptidase [Anaerolineales bacterium]